MISAPIIDYLKKGIFTLLGLLLAVYLFVILMTYTGNDPSWSHISSDMTAINNMGGEMGAWLSDLLYSFFGFGAWWLLAFLVYESVLIWWDNKPTFWLLRLVAYVFLILSSSALFAQLIALLQQVADPISSWLKGVAGGIIGLELQARLAQLLSQWGSVTFLAVFVAITTTFAFNIHWMSIYEKFKTLSWFGSGVKNLDSTLDDNEIKQEDNATSAVNKQGRDTAISENNTPEYEQLPLELQAAEQSNTKERDSRSGRFNSALTDFLSSSGLGASVKASMAAAAQVASESAKREEPLQTAAATTTGNSAFNLSQTSASANAAPVPIRKVEPSFAWNDANTVDDLLANQIVTEQDIIPYEAVNNSFDSSNTDASFAQPVIDAIQADSQQSSEQTATSTLDSSTDTAPTTPTTHADTPKAASIDTLVDAWLAEHAAVPETTDFNNEQELSVIETLVEMPAAPTKQQTAISLNDSTDELSNNSSAELPENLAPSFNADVANASEITDMTPTNTPPTNPKALPIAESMATISSIESATAPKPTMNFAVPEGDSSNHITDMMPEDDNVYDSADDIHAPVMPHISDDIAFSQKSRSMQTAAYRSSLSPIPELSILDKPDPNRQPSYTLAELEQLSELLEIKLQEFNVKANVVNAIPGPVVTRFEVDLAPGIKASKVTGISRDLARSLSMASLRVVEVIPGKPYIGIEVPNKQREMVRLIELLDTEKFKDPKAQISMAMGKDIGGKAIITDLARAPHMLVAGTTGSGKSVLVNAMLLSMLLKYTPNELRMILIDPKQLELANYNDIPHLLTPVVTDMTEAASALSWCVAEMERRYQLMSLLKVRKLNEFNKKVIAAEKSGNPMLDPLWRPNDSVSISQAPKLKTLPMIVIVADEFADMIMQVGKQAEELITRLAQKSRAAGIHLILATQRPSVDVITGLIKANIPVRAALRVNSKVDSRTILDSGGAEDMLGNGDMLFLGPGQIEPDRVHGAYVSDEEVNSVCDAWRERGAPDYIDNMAGNFELSSPNGGSNGNASASGEDDDLYNEAVGFIMETRKVSASSIQRKFSIGYNRAARIVDSMEEAGLVSSMGKSGKRELLM
ncbi:MAG TPA: DNA translocase FtsK 4TM domain-containing protein [Psychrobacter sp.]|uniref:DNA translocase FtsK n=1 Tax=Psychrobacter sp. TaxID=56811 RepID=UPI002B698FF6|nr:DNA translocase FtsK 4TM domain-containing protein [Psychrobacter sp.]HSP84264.1 DNA translocase FtsK 4TM domain-containing protein [Psychrobacter sp.]